MPDFECFPHHIILDGKTSVTVDSTTFSCVISRGHYYWFSIASVPDVALEVEKSFHLLTTIRGPAGPSLSYGSGIKFGWCIDTHWVATCSACSCIFHYYFCFWFNVAEPRFESATVPCSNCTETSAVTSLLWRVCRGGIIPDNLSRATLMGDGIPILSAHIRHGVDRSCYNTASPSAHAFLPTVQRSHKEQHDKCWHEDGRSNCGSAERIMPHGIAKRPDVSCTTKIPLPSASQIYSPKAAFALEWERSIASSEWVLAIGWLYLSSKQTLLLCAWQETKGQKILILCYLCRYTDTL